MKTLLATTAAAIALAGAAAAMTPATSQLEVSVQNDLDRLGISVDVSSLDAETIVELYAATQGGDRFSDRQAEFQISKILNQ